MNPWSNPWLLSALAPLCLALGAWAYRTWDNRRTRRQRRIPKHWPLNTRHVANSEEVRVWHWLARAFYDHHILIKVPVTRFTLPRDQDQGMDWYKLLAGVYCTFTVCRSDGRVIGCIDVPGRSGIPRSTRALKNSLLTQCGMPYWVVHSSNLPTVTEIRAEFLGETPTAQAMREREREERAVIAAQNNLRSAIQRQRSNRGSSDFGPVSSWPTSTTGDSRADASQWQDNSFLVPLDSRKGELL
ncbi:MULTISPECIES: DUF2726 domain-containing protein [Hydrogenophaga]|uniref:DUF2726 domain-containing protein n=1 Tax=Hydrogenophaga electricum TaxID=1230953 RepID=A0ABQ6C828_9BURK|nr:MULTISPECIES: DUF2726 domain-containing protein [Hydrogenophaga]GLS16190.1 hypothetical protein GCM10007935_36300 [Hydrogenophaga electricum]